ncbi:hypothetical protein NQK81_05045 [Amycolatopsis roodepoortensis]|nr:hypothetical protein [Amycolatopsis roodepoortensis]UUV32826.1 hypothetical protein NQK81_05045 [Amycolatopsis roodepoortensis]
MSLGESLERMRGLILGCRLVTIEDAGHRVAGGVRGGGGELLGPA